MKIIIHITVFCLVVVVLSSCSEFQLTEKVESFNPHKQPIQKIVILQPDCYKAREGYNVAMFEYLHKNSYTIRLEKALALSCKKMAARFTMATVIPGVTDSLDPIYFNDLSALKNEITGMGGISDMENRPITTGRYKKQLLSDNLILSPELQNLQKVYGTPYFLYNKLIQTDRLYMLSVLADVSTGKIVYRDLKEVTVKPRKANLDVMVFNTFYEMLVLK